MREVPPMTNKLKFFYFLRRQGGSPPADHANRAALEQKSIGTRPLQRGRRLALKEKSVMSPRSKFAMSSFFNAPVIAPQAASDNWKMKQKWPTPQSVSH